MNARAAVVAAGWSYVMAIAIPAEAQHEHHGPSSLDTVTVSAKREPVELRSGATIVNVRASSAAGGSIADLLRTVPGLDVDPDGRITMRGSTSVLVLMNGRRIGLTGEALARFLRQMPAVALERIETGTSASVREGADGAGGVVNLVFHDDSVPRSGKRSLAGSIATDDHYMVSAAATGNGGNALRWDAMYSLSATRPHTHSMTERWSLVPGDLPLQTDQDTRAREKHQLHSVVTGAAVKPTPNTSVSLRGSYSWMKGSYRNSSAFLYTNSAGNTGSSRTGTSMDHEIPSGELTAVAGIDRGAARFTSEARASVVDEDFLGAHDDADAGYRYMTTAMGSRQITRVLRNDLGLRLSRTDLDVGQESEFRTITAKQETTHFGSTGSQSYRHEADVHAGYLKARRASGGVRAEAGVRMEAERTRVEVDALTSRTAVRFFPSISGVWTDAGSALVYRLAYARHINRPSCEMLNPFTMGEDEMTDVIGNPRLLPEVSDQVELGIERHGSRLTMQLTPFLRWTRDPVRPLMAATATGGSRTTLENLNSARSSGADGSVRARLAGGTVVTLASTLAHTVTAGDVFRSSGMYATTRLTVDLRIAENTAVQLYAYRRSSQVIEQGEILPAFTGDVALTQRLAGDRGRVALRLSDPLRSDRLEFRIADPSFTQKSSRRTARPLLSLFASYAVGGTPREDTPVRTEGPVRIF
jgi:ferric enterobactin receptor